MANRSSRTHGFTLVETLVVVVIFCIIAALILPAVQSARESSRRIQCCEHLRSIGQAMANFQSSNGHFPQGIKADGYFRSGQFAYPMQVSGQTQLLPFLEQQSLYNSINSTRPSTFSANVSVNFDAPNITAKSIGISSFYCPSDRNFVTNGNNYRFNVGPLPFLFENTPWPGGLGPFPGFLIVHPADITDGMSQTVGISERVQGSFSNKFQRNSDLWFTGILNVRSTLDSDEMLTICGSISEAPGSFFPNMGYTWIVAGLETSLYNHVATPNPIISDCAVDGPSSSNDVVVSGGAVSARSYHSGGVNSLFMDGTVHFMRNSIYLAVWRSLSTRSASDLVSSSEF